MKKFEIIRVSDWWSTSSLMEKAENTANQKSQEGYQIVNISFGYSIWLAPSAYITITKAA
ncbi:hypothetical protein GCM10011514_29150 [Emticicia aquatilis]|uniref:DUF4177 domain-containing protein n=1 Tax=Emticicia aquatilis TaxID=1537369 RepID=A0A916YVW5_9BACT|nr:hypothetical protein [Emticicia aquatilis]GGD63290.1 hypothetical protein GCM10011514_29150 [Emticicia aquatilis]